MTDQFLDDLAAYHLPAHLVLDGARVVNLGGANITDRLRNYDLEARPLFRETADRATVLAGPWLVSLGTGNASLTRSLALAREIGKGEFWLGEPDSEVLFRHLRKLGAARMPDGQVLYFRYYDSDVLAAIVPLVNAEQASYLFGPARVLGLIGGAGHGATVERPDGLPESILGPIAFEPWQIDLLDARQTEISHRKIAAMLRESFQKETKSLSSSEIYRLVQESDSEASSHGVTSERAHAKWAFLKLLFLDKPNSNEYIRNNLVDPKSSSVNESVETNFENIIRANFEHKTLTKRA